MAPIGFPANRSPLPTASLTAIPTAIKPAPFMADTLTITDNRTGKQYEVPITDGAIRATDLRQIKAE